ncbi:MAG: ABC transporter ATP-binding protein [Anaerolineales bacterium]|jgi:ABC-2 type transport system ATP-binding protein
MSSHPSQEYAIHTQGLTRKYGEVEALVDLHLSVPYGSIFGYLGRNGAGKTTTIRLLTGLAQATSGRAWVAGHEISITDQPSKNKVGYLPQEPGLYPWMKGREFLIYIARLLSIPPREIQDQVDRALELTNLTPAAHRKIGGYSGGMKQRLSIAQAMLGNPSILILDEPTSSLDPAGRQELLDTLAAMRKQVTVFLSSHILADIERICDTIAVLHEGRLMLTSSREQLFSQYPVFAASLELEADFIAPQAFLDELGERPWVERVARRGQNITILAKDVPQGKTELLPMIVKHAIRIDKYEWIRPSLEEIFLKISK